MKETPDTLQACRLYNSIPFYFSHSLCVREKIGYYESVNIINPEDAAIVFKAEGHYPKRLRVEAWTSYRDYRNRKYGVLLKYVLLLLRVYIFFLIFAPVLD